MKAVQFLRSSSRVVPIALAMPSRMLRLIWPVLLNLRSVRSVVPAAIANSVNPIPRACRYSSSLRTAVGEQMVAESLRRSPV
jgi:hypothetical protein